MIYANHVLNIRYYQLEGGHIKQTIYNFRNLGLCAVSVVLSEFHTVFRGISIHRPVSHEIATLYDGLME